MRKPKFKESQIVGVLQKARHVITFSPPKGQAPIHRSARPQRRFTLFESRGVLRLLEPLQPVGGVRPNCKFFNEPTPLDADKLVRQSQHKWCLNKRTH